MAGPYTTQANIIKEIGRSMLVKLTDDEKVGDVNTEVVTSAISWADNKIDLYCRGRYPVDMDTVDVPEAIVDYSTCLAVFWLYKRRLQVTLPDALAKDYKNTMKDLRDIQAGKLTPWEQEDEPTIILSNKTSDSKVFNSTLWAGYDRD